MLQICIFDVATTVRLKKKLIRPPGASTPLYINTSFVSSTFLSGPQNTNNAACRAPVVCLAGSPPPKPQLPAAPLLSPAASPAPTRHHVVDAAHEPGGHQVRGVLRPGAPHGGELPGPLRQRLLRRHRLPPQHQGLHDPGRRPHGDRQGRRLHLGHQVRRRVQGVPQAQREGDHVDGQQRAQHQRQPVLHHLRQAAAPQRPLHHLRQGHPRLRGPRPHGEGADRTGGQAARRDQAQPRHHPRQPTRRLIHQDLENSSCILLLLIHGYGLPKSSVSASTSYCKFAMVDVTDLRITILNREL